MRTTVEFEEDTAAAIDKLRRETGMGPSEAVNELIRKGLLPRRDSVPFVQTTHWLGLRWKWGMNRKESSPTTGA